MINYGPDCPLIIDRLTQWTASNPTQWDGLTVHYAPVYIRYRYGSLTVSVGPDDDPCLFYGLDYAWEWNTSDGTQGRTLNAQGLRALLPEWITLPEGFGND